MRDKTLAIADEIARSVKEYCARAVEPFTSEIKALAQKFEASLAAVQAKFDALPAPERGEKGDPGEQGAPGHDGLHGKDGKDGTDGKPGERGEKGDPGKDGRDGKDGFDGKDADSAAIIAEVLAVAEKHISESVASLPAPAAGKDGLNGKDGRDGVDGKPGERGDDGKSVDVPELHRLIGDLVSRAVSGIQLPRDGRDGKDGRDGEAGRDATQLNPLLGVDAAKSYPRGTWAAYRGGMVFSTRQTDPFDENAVGEITLSQAGWAVALEGIHHEHEESIDDGRRIEKLTVYTSGREKRVSRIGRSTLYRGIFKPGAEYLRGDEVTWSGSIWHCMAESTKEHPGNGSQDWVLAVKQGDRGKSAPEAGDHKRTTVRIK